MERVFANIKKLIVLFFREGASYIITFSFLELYDILTEAVFYQKKSACFNTWRNSYNSFKS